MDKAVIEETVILASRHDSAVAMQPGVRPFHQPAALVVTHASAVVGWLLDAVAAMRTAQKKVTPVHFLLQRVAILRTVGDHRRKRRQRDSFGDGRPHRFPQRGRSAVGRGGRDAEWHARAFHDQFTLPLSHLGLADVVPPCCAPPKGTSAKSSSVPSRWASSSSSTMACQRRSHRPAANHSLCRRPQVASDGKWAGMSRQRQPRRRTTTMTSQQSRSEARGCPSNGLSSCTDSKALIRSHSESFHIGSGAPVGRTDLPCLPPRKATIPFYVNPSLETGFRYLED
jgi:hypothetical protein